LPALLAVTVQLTTSVTDVSTVGTLIEGKVAGNAIRKGKIVLPDGASVQGRIRRLERYDGSGGGDFIVGLEFTTVQVNGKPQPLYGDLLRLDRRPGVRQILSERVLAHGRGGYQSRN
jgi:hypothetical protein